MNQPLFWAKTIEGSMIALAIFLIWVLVESFSKRPIWGLLLLTSLTTFACSFISLHGSPIQTQSIRNVHIFLGTIILYLILAILLLVSFLKRKNSKSFES